MTAAVARLPLAAFSIAVLVHVQRLTGSFAVAGVTCGALALAQGIGGPLLGRLVDGRGQTRVLVTSALVASGTLGALAVLPTGAPVGVLVGLAAGLGLTTPPVGACLRTLLAVVVPAGDRLRRAYAADAAVTELTWVSGPPLVLLAVTISNSGVALLAVAAVLAPATLRFATLPVSRHWRPSCEHHLSSTSNPAARRSPRGALDSTAMRTLVLVLIGVGVLFGATEVAVTATAGAAGHSASAGLLLGLWGIGSFAGGIAATRYGSARSGRGLAVLLAGLGASHLALAPAGTSMIALGVVITLAGGLIAPILASAYAMVDAAAAGTITEAFAWLATATAVGTAAGAAGAGALADTASPAAGFLLAGTTAILGALLAAARRHTLPAATPTSASAPAVPALT